MSALRIFTTLTSRFACVDWVLLLLMLGITQNRFFALKLVAIAVAVAFTPCLRALRRPGLHFFYLAMAALTVIQYAAIVRDYSAAYTLVALYAIVQWLMMAIIAAMLLGKIDRNPARSRASLNMYFWIVAGFSIINLISILVQAGTWNPYENAPEPIFGMSSGDHIAGLYGFHLWTLELGDYSNVNAAILSFFVCFYFYHKSWGKSALAFVLMLAASSNAITLATLAILGLLVLMERRASYLAAGLGAFAIAALFYVFITPKNLEYLTGQLSSKLGIDIAKPVSKNPAPKKAPDWELPPAEIASRAGKLDFDVNITSGKSHSFRQTWDYLLSSPVHFIAGAGAGRFSSQLAEIAASSPEAKGRVFRPLSFQSPEYRNGHGKTIATIKKLPPGYHTVSQMPYSWYNQMLGEYGFVGFLLFALLYVGWCLRHGWRSAGKYLLLLFLLMAVTDYIFETFCMVPVFEWLLMLSRKIRSIKIMESTPALT